MKTIGTVTAVVFAIVAVEAFYAHPTYGRGVKALIAVIQAGGAL
jgi:hypothetical protein